MNEHLVKRRKKLIEVVIPLDKINQYGPQEKNNPFLKAHPRNIHKWWARRPFAAAGALIFCQLVDDPWSYREEFPSDESCNKKREYLHDIAARLADWDERNNAELRSLAQLEISSSWKRYCKDNPGDSEDNKNLPVFIDPFSGGGAIPYEALHLGLTTIASDINPVACLINKCLVEIPYHFVDLAPVGPLDMQGEISLSTTGLDGLAEDIRRYSRLIEQRLRTRVGHLYPQVCISNTNAQPSSHLSRYTGRAIDLSACLWARTVPSPDPAFKGEYVPLISTYILSNRKGKECYLSPVFDENGAYRFDVIKGVPPASAALGTKVSAKKADFRCILSGAPITAKYIREQAQKGEMRSVILCGIFQGDREKVFIPSSLIQYPKDDVEKDLEGSWIPDLEFFPKALGFRIGNYGLNNWSDVFTKRQIVTLSALADLLRGLEKEIADDFCRKHSDPDLGELASNGNKPKMYAQAIISYLSLALSKLADYSNTLCTWNPTNQNIGHLFKMHYVSMTWDYPEVNPLSGGLSYSSVCESVASAVQAFETDIPEANVIQMPCQEIAGLNRRFIISTDPPYYDNIGYADLSDFFYVWLRRVLSNAYPDLFRTLSTPKQDEMVATPDRHGGRKQSESFFVDEMFKALSGIHETLHPAYPMTIYYAFKQSETDMDSQTSSTGWSAFLNALIGADLQVLSAWPVRTERPTRTRALSSNALATSLVLSCIRKGKRPNVSRAAFRASLREELRLSLKTLESASIPPVDIRQALLGPGIKIFTSYNSVILPDDSGLEVPDALREINNAIDEVMSGEERRFDSHTWFAIFWFESYGHEERPFGDAEGLALARNTSVANIEKSGIMKSLAGKIRLLCREDLPSNWMPEDDGDISIWEATQHLIKTLGEDGEESAALLLTRTGNAKQNLDIGTECYSLAVRMFNFCEKTKQAEEARAYNGLVVAWPELEKRASAAQSSSKSIYQDTLI
jgi:putative DNA methylase